MLFTGLDLKHLAGRYDLILQVLKLLVQFIAIHLWINIVLRIWQDCVQSHGNCSALGRLGGKLSFLPVGLWILDADEAGLAELGDHLGAVLAHFLALGRLSPKPLLLP